MIRPLLAPVPDPAPAPAAERMLTLAGLSDRLQVSRSKIERDVLAGLPHLDVGRHDPRRRVKRSLRFSWPDVLRWYQERPR